LFFYLFTNHYSLSTNHLFTIHRPFMDEQKKIEKIIPTELGVWMVCRKKWLYDFKRRQARRLAEKDAGSPPAGGKPAPETQK